MKKLLLIMLLPMVLFAAPNQARLVWSVETSNPTERTLDLRRGETIDLECRFTSYAAPMDLTGYRVVLHAVTNGMAAGTSFQTTGTVTNAASASVAVAVDSWLPASFASGTYTLEASSPTGLRRILRASGKLTVSGLHYPSLSDPVPVSWATNIYAILDTKLAAPDVVAGDYVNIVPDGRKIRISSTAPLGGVTVTNPIVRIHNPANVARSWAEIRGAEIWVYTVTDLPLWRLDASDLLDTPATNYYSTALPYPLATLTNTAANTEFFFGGYRLTVGLGSLFWAAGGDIPDAPSTLDISDNFATGFTNELNYARLAEFNPPYGTLGTVVLTYGDYGFTQTNVTRYVVSKPGGVLDSNVYKRTQVRVVASNSLWFANGTAFTNALTREYLNVFNYQNQWVWQEKNKTVSGTNEYGQLEYSTDYQWLSDTTFARTNITEDTYFGRSVSTDSVFPIVLTNKFDRIEFYRETYK